MIVWTDILGKPKEAFRPHACEEWDENAKCYACALSPQNIQAWEVYSRVATQVVTAGMGEVVGLNIPAILQVMTLLGIEADEQSTVLDKILTIHDSIYPAEKRKKDIEEAKRRLARQQAGASSSAGTHGSFRRARPIRFSGRR